MTKEELIKENKHLQEQLDVALKDYDKYYQCWEELKEWIINDFWANIGSSELTKVVEKMQELEEQK